MNSRLPLLIFLLLVNVAGVHAGHTNVARYTFEGNSVLASDMSGNTNHISASGYGGGGSVFITNAAAVGSYAVFFNNNGGAGYAYVRPSANVLTALAGSFSFSLWLKTTQVSGSDTDSGVNNAGVASAPGVGLNWVLPMVITGSKLAFVTGGSSQHTLRSTNAVNTGAYVHIVVTRDQPTGAKKIYRNGVLDASGTGATDLLNTPTELRIGSNNTLGLNGSVDDIQIYSGVLSASEIAALYATPGSVAPNVAGGSFDSALNTSGLTWTTGGEASWFVQTTTTHDNDSAARSGAIDDDAESWIQTTVTGPGTLTYWWKVSSEEDLDYLEFIVDGTPQDEITGESGWQQRTNVIAAGTHTLRWRYFKDDFCCSDGLDAGFLDQVSFVGPPPVTPSVKFSLEIVREQRAEHESSSPNQFRFWARPGLSATNTPLSIHQVESPGGYYSATLGSSGSSSSTISTTFAEMANRVTNGNWTLWLNKNTASEQVFNFTVSALSFASNDFSSVTITAPLNGATTVASNTPYQWSIPGTWNDLFIQARQVRFGTNHFYAFAFPASNTTTWAAGPVLAAGTNFFNVRYQKNVPANFAVSTPYAGWSVEYIRLENNTTSGFIVADNSGPPPNLNIALTTTNTVAVFWPSPSLGFGLQQNTNGIGSVNWSNVTTVPTDNGTNKTVIIDPPTGDRYYRLFKP